MSNLRNPVWGPDQDYIECEILLGGNQWVPFTARADDGDPKTRAIFATLREMGPAPYVPPLREITSRDVNVARNRKMARFDHDGYSWQADPASLINIAVAAQAALTALTEGVAADDVRWHGGDDPFAWITADNELVTMGPGAVIALNRAAMLHGWQAVVNARAVKDMDEIPEDFEGLL